MTQAHKHGNTFPYYVVKLFFLIFSKGSCQPGESFAYEIYIYLYIFNLLHNRRFNECVGRHDFLNNDI